jgi:hypothetical protein
MAWEREGHDWTRRDQEHKNNEVSQRWVLGSAPGVKT